MFTGIIEGVGTIAAVDKGMKSVRLHLNASRIVDDLNLGDSVAVNGVCLTVAKLTHQGFSADVMPETMRHTGFQKLTPGTPVNLERALPANGRFGGHIVSGHIDGVGTLLTQTRDDNAVWLRISTSEEILKFFIKKGSAAIDGVSLTVIDVTNDNFTISMIPHTAANTTLLQKQTGDMVNIECDIVGKYIHRFLHTAGSDERHSNITAEFLSKHGF